MAPLEVPERQALIADLTGGREYSRQERAALEMSALLRFFRRRRELLEGSLTAPQVAELLGSSRQTPHDRARSDNLLAVLDRSRKQQLLALLSNQCENGTFYNCC